MKNSLFVLVLLMLAGCSVPHNNVDELVVGTCAGFPPYEEFDVKGDVVGFDLDVVQKIAEKLGKKLVIKNMSFDVLFVALKQGKIDMIVAGMSITKTRLAAIAMVHYHGKPLKSIPILFWQKIPAGVATIADLANQPNKTVCAQVGTIQEEIISKYTFLDIKHLENNQDLIMDIKHGKSIAAVLEPMVVTALQQQMPEIKTMDLPLKEDEQDMGHGIGINKNNKKFIAAVEAAVKQLKAAGTIVALEQKWFNGDNHDSK